MKRGKKNFPQLIDRYRSGIEERVSKQLSDMEVYYEYEKHKVKYIVPERASTYLPDFKVGNVFIEVKGSFSYDGPRKLNSAEERQKLLLVRDQNPGIDIRLVFGDASRPIYSGSPTTMGKWADDHGFLWSDKGVVPSSWVKS